MITLIGEFTINGETAKGMEVDPSKGLVRFNEASGVLAIVGIDANGKLIKGITSAEEGIMQQLTCLGSKGTRDESVRVPVAF